MRVTANRHVHEFRFLSEQWNLDQVPHTVFYTFYCVTCLKIEKREA